MATGIPKDLPPIHFRSEDRKLKRRVEEIEPEKLIKMGTGTGTIVCFMGWAFISLGYQERMPGLMLGGTFMSLLGLTWPTPK